MDKKMYRVGVLIAVGLFLNAFVGLMNLCKGTPAYAQGNPQATILYAYDAHTATPEPLTAIKRTVDGRPQAVLGVATVK